MKTSFPKTTISSTFKRGTKFKNDIDTLNQQLEIIDKRNIDLNDKQTFIIEIQSALRIGDTCPICGNEIESLNQHIDFETINQNHQLLDKLSNEINEKTAFK